MENSIVRLTGLHISNFKNVQDGRLSFENTRKNYDANIVGLYGQNGSGKTALIDAIELLQYVLRGVPVPEKFADYINIDADFATIEYSFKITMGEVYRVSYQLSIARTDDDAVANMNSLKGIVTEKVCIFNEIIKCPSVTEKKSKTSVLIDTKNGSTFSPQSKRMILVGKGKEADLNLRVGKKIALSTSRSFIFSNELLSVIRSRVTEAKERNEEAKELFFYSSILESLVKYGDHELFIVNTSTTGFMSINTQPESSKRGEPYKNGIGTVMISLNNSTIISQSSMEILENIIANMNIVLTKIVPNLTVSIKNIGAQVMENNEIGVRIQLMSCKNGKEIALKYESEGIKKIISILQLLINVYNQRSITVAVDELDAGIFEYLLGELLRIISEKGKGQLIFTSHNLRPLETLDRGFISFTTTNSKQRYMRLKNVKDNNNLRDFYYRDIMLGEQTEELYDMTNNSEIALAMRKAGR